MLLCILSLLYLQQSNRFSFSLADYNDDLFLLLLISQLLMRWTRLLVLLTAAAAAAKAGDEKRNNHGVFLLLNAGRVSSQQQITYYTEHNYVWQKINATTLHRHTARHCCLLIMSRLLKEMIRPLIGCNRRSADSYRHQNRYD